MQSRGFLDTLLGLLLKTGLLLMENVLHLLAKSFLISWGITVASAAADAAMHEKS